MSSLIAYRLSTYSEIKSSTDGFFRTLPVILLFMFKKWYRISEEENDIVHDWETKARVEDKKSFATHCNIVCGSWSKTVHFI